MVKKMNMCGDERFKIIEKAKQDLLKNTNIDSAPEEMAVLDNILFRCWQMGWLDIYDDEAESVPSAVFEQAYSEPDMVQAMMAASHGTAQRKRRETNGHTRTTTL